MKKSNITILIIILASFILASYLYPIMPEKMASHWNAQGDVDDYMPKFWGLFLMPIISILMFLMFIFIPMIDPLRKNIEKFRKYYEWFITLIIVFLFYIYTLTLLWNLNFRFNMAHMLIPALGILFYYTGVLMDNAKMNWFIGIRTPWTLSSEKVWRKTHKIGGKLFKISGIITLIGTFLGKYTLFFVIIPVSLSSIYLIVYSYICYKKETKSR